MRSLLAGVVVTASLAGLADARAEQPTTVHLLYDPGDTERACPTEANVRRGVAARLGRDPFDADAPRTVRATIDGKGRGLTAVITVVEDDGTVAGARTLESRQGDCDELGRSVELAIAIAIDPIAAMSVEPSAEEQPIAPAAQATAEPADSPTIAAQLPPERPAPRVLASPGAEAVAKAGVVVGTGSTPGTAPGLVGALGVGKGQLSILVEGRLDWPASHSVGQASIRGTQVMGSIAGCAHMGRWVGCALGSAGALWASGHGFDQNLSSTTPLIALGGRLGLRQQIVGLTELEWFVDVRAPLTRTELTVDGMEAWTSKPLMGTLGLAAVWGGSSP